jgi:hypothetical protein
MPDDDPDKPLLIETLNRLNRLSQTRNKIVHTAMSERPVGSGTLVRYRRQPGRTNPVEYVPVKAVDLRQHTNVLMEVVALLALITFPEAVEEMQRERQRFASQEKQPPQ